MKMVKSAKSTDHQSHFNAKMTKRTANIVAAVATNVKKGQRVTCKDLTSAHGVSKGTMHNILRDHLELVKKSARCVPRLLTEDQKQKRVRTCIGFIVAVTRHSRAMLD
jgi:hypothetical protein